MGSLVYSAVLSKVTRSSASYSLE